METTSDIIQESAEASVNEMQSEMNSFIQYIQDHIPDMVSFGIRLLIALLIFAVGRIVIQIIRKSVRLSIERTHADAGVAQFTDSLLKFGLYVFLIIIVAGNLGMEMTSITALFAAAGVGISLALQGTLSNLAGGIQILVLKPFAVGDYIIEDTNKNEGTVKEIKVFYTKLSTLDNRTIVIPNGILTGNSLTNVTAKDERQLDLKIGISYESDLKKAKYLLETMLEKNANIIKEEECRVFVDSLGDSAVIIGVRAWVKTEEYWMTRWKVLEDIKLMFDAEGIEIPYHQLKVHMSRESGNKLNY
ncbi:mechanosensitive ion channel family protein [Mediterraneibacter agrestimuris]|uniref:mechanosensitive ion channel family protein n=1 Tax=Mediterraneibacter agrestimuris TaxID=2941333 RepID=UPI00203F36E2|nr:mechanosensitive ion channel domain-containing protein [Mediterraneibacter agrestimuris]